MANTNLHLFIIILSIFLCAQFISSQSFNFSFNNFNDTNFIEQGSTILTPNGALGLTNKTRNSIGHAFYPSPIQMSNTTSFSTYFVFRIRSPSGRDSGGFGLAFTLSPSAGFPGAAGEHYFGVFNPQNNGNTTNRIFMVEFDTVNGFNESEDTYGNHVGINVNGMPSRASHSASYYVDGATSNTEEMDLERYPIQAWIDYDGSTKRVNVTVSPLSVSKPVRPLISEFISDLDAVFGGDMYAGFSAATGSEKSSSHFILGWSFRTNGEADHLDLTQLPIVPNDGVSSSNAKLKTALISTFSVLLFILLVTLVSIIVYRRVMKFEILEDWELDCPRRFHYRDLHHATKGFKESEIIGSGGFGTVYKGILPTTGVEIAVKKIISKNSLQGMREFAAEIESLGRLRHKHLVNLQGWCKHGNDLLLIYDYIANGSLDSLLYGSNKGIFLNWEQRFRIIKGIAAGLLYLHEEWGQIVIHRDVKSSNVLIDHEMNAKLSDFGLARLYDHGKNSHTTNVVGTIGYIAPELTRVGKASTSSDVFAYGILLLEVACGRAPVVYEADRNVILVDWVIECMNSGNIFDAADARLNSVYEVDEMELVLGLGLLCSHPKEEARPKMREVMKYLNRDEILPVFDKLSEAGSRRIDELTSRFLALGLRGENTFNTTLYYSSSVGQISTDSFDSGR